MPQRAPVLKDADQNHCRGQLQQAEQIYCSFAGQTAAAAAVYEPAGQPDPAATSKQPDAAVGGGAATQPQPTATEAGAQPDTAASAEQQVDGQPAGEASDTVARAAAEQQLAGPSDAGLRKAAAELELPVEVLAVNEPAVQAQAAGVTAGAAGAQQAQSDVGAAAAQLSESVAGAASSVRDTGTGIPMNEALAAAQAEALGIRNLIPRSAVAVSGSPGGVSDEDLAAEAAEVRRRRDMQGQRSKATRRSRRREA